MDRSDQVRKEPTLADLEAFEKLLRDSLQAEPARQGIAARPAAAPEVHASNPDQAAMAELARLIQSPLEFETPVKQALGDTAAAPAPVAEHHVQGSAEAALTEDWKATPTVAATFSTGSTPAYAQPQPVPPPEPLDPLAAFEEELRRFDAIRMAEQQPAPGLRAEYPGSGYPADQTPGAPQGQGYHPPEQYAEPQVAADHTWYADSDPARAPERNSETYAETSLSAAENRLAAEAAAAAGASGATTSSANRSRGIFLALSGIAVAGLAIIGGSFVLGSSKKSGTAGNIPVIAAKTEPTKEKPSDPGGVEIPNQNKQVLASRNSPEAKPSQVVNTTEQPLDLNQVTKRDSVRIITPSPFQATPGSSTTTGTATTPEPAAVVGGGPLVEPRRVTSVRIPIGGGDSAPAPSPGAASVAAIAAGATARPSTAVPAPSLTAPSVSAPPIAAPVRQDLGAPVIPPKVETRPVTAQARPETPKAAPPPKVAAAPSAPKATPPRAATAPLSLNPPKTTAAAPSGGSGFAIQLASRPTEADARTASTQLRSKFASAIGSRATQVVSGEANGQTVYRVRVGGFSQADAVAACVKVKAAGGGCFVTRQ